MAIELHRHALTWSEGADHYTTQWMTERLVSAPKQVLLADDTFTADMAYREIMQGAVLLYRGDFQNAKQLMSALARRVDKRKGSKKAKPEVTAAHAFHLHRQSQAQRARVLNSILVPLNADFTVPLRRAPEVHEALQAAWGILNWQGLACISLRELLGLIGAFEWRKKGVEIAALGAAPNNRVFPFYGVYSPVRGEYLNLLAKADVKRFSRPDALAFDIGTGTAVIAALLARRGVPRILATELDPRALDCATFNVQQLGVQAQVSVVQADLFPSGQADLLVCNPPWLPAKPVAAIERAIYDDNSAMLKGYLNGVKAHLKPGGEAWLVMSDLAEHLGLRKPGELQHWIAQAGLRVVHVTHTRPVHSKSLDPSDPLHQARKQEVTSLFVLEPAV
ncbi:class I SAM-dependent methyltransferase [Limnobacter humi]|uniref:Class I SAM-dependent methyltransferase n=1 Tax=Limnobacter humi TaxID=1778671 RepID=A0ABT1WC28_9BURK|nr:class I SAM-dependent methyltransferase [Limnobacter humi]MCQ8895060.1 class I SAM-dependent methyltransferase [Limnobacter humi]